MISDELRLMGKTLKKNYNNITFQECSYCHHCSDSNDLILDTTKNISGHTTAEFQHSESKAALVSYGSYG